MANDKLQRRRVQEENFSVSLSGKHVFGAYLNMALYNFNKTMLYIFAQSGINGNYSDKQIIYLLHALYLKSAFTKPNFTPIEKQLCKSIFLKNADDQIQMQSLLFKHFPALEVIILKEKEKEKEKEKRENEKSEKKKNTNHLGYTKDISLADCLRVIHLLGMTLAEQRNYYTHADPYDTKAEREEQYKHQSEIVDMLDWLTKSSRGVLKKQEGLTQREFEFMTGTERYQKVGKVFREHEDFYFTVKKKYEDKKNNKKIYILSDFGVLYLGVLFLSKNYAKLFVEESKLFKCSPFNEDENNVMLDMMSIYRVHRPRLHRLDSKDNKSAMTMDMLTEMRRCPQELYELLSPEDRAKFEMDNDYKMLRNGDRFPYMMLQYIDENEMFKYIRFQLLLGSFRYKFYDKQCIDSETRVRRLQKEIHGYGRLQDVRDKRLEMWAEVLQKRQEQEDKELFVADNAETQPYITDRQPSYHISNNRIGLYWERNKDPRQFELFDADYTYLPKLSVEHEDKSIDLVEPRCFLSIYDIGAMYFYEYLRKTHNADAPSAEQLIIDYEEQYRRFFDEVAQGKITPCADKEAFAQMLAQRYPLLSISGIPDKLRLYLSGSTLMHEGQTETSRQRLVRLTIDALNKRAEEIQLRLDTLKVDREKGNVKHGKLARYLAKSMLEWQPSLDGKGFDKLTGENFNVLTNYLAVYNEYRVTQLGGLKLAQVLKNAHLLDSNNRHPFLQDVLNNERGNRNVEQFYWNYLIREKQYVLSCKKALESNPSDSALAALPFVHYRSMRFAERTEQEMRSLASRYSAVQLPDGLFTSHILHVLKTACADNAELQAALTIDKDKSVNPLNNASYLLSVYYRTVLHDNSQPFYFYERIGEVTKAHDRAIRRFKSQDMILFLATKVMLVRLIMANNKNLPLDDIKLENVCTESLLRHTFTMRVSVPINGEKVFIEQQNMSFKNYGEFYRCLADERLETLLTGIVDSIKPNKQGEKVVRYGDIMNELLSYDRNRSKVFELAQMIERVALHSHAELYDPSSPAFFDEGNKDLPKRNNFKAMIKLIDRLNNTELTDAQRTLLITIRNAFSHNNYKIDLQSVMKIRQLPEVANGITKYLQQFIA